MRWVECAAIRPQRCAAIPFIGMSDPEGFIDTGSELDGFDNHVYISVKAVREMARLIGLPTVEEHRKAVTGGQELALELAEAVMERDELRAKFAAIDVLASADFRARNKPGRKPAKTEKVGV